MLKAPTKITFKNFTKMTLNARFTSIMKSRPPATSQTSKAHVTTEKLASEKNRKLALQMENRHSVKSAPAAVPAPFVSRLSVRDRLGAVRGNVTTNRARGVLRGASRRGSGFQRQTYSTRGKTFQTSQAGRSRVSLNRVSRGGVQKRGTSNFRGRGRGRGKTTPVDKSKLDNELDSYMSKTRGSMDAELDEYMANLGSS